MLVCVCYIRRKKVIWQLSYFKPPHPNLISFSLSKLLTVKNLTHIFYSVAPHNSPQQQSGVIVEKKKMYISAGQRGEAAPGEVVLGLIPAL